MFRKSLLLFFCCVYLHLSAQESTELKIPNYAAKTPEAATFLKYGEYPVNLSTGVPSISIPLYTIELKGYQMPITLDYHASGIKVKQEASWVGLGWNLTCGATIVRSVRDEVDEFNGLVNQEIAQWMIDWYTPGYHPYAYNSGPLLGPDKEKSRIKDVYFVSAPTVNGSYYISQNGQAIVFPPDAFKVEFGVDNANIKITDPSGVIYRFNTDTELSDIIPTHGEQYVSAWYVRQIETAQEEIINFTYRNDGETVDTSLLQRFDLLKTGNLEGAMTYNVSSLRQQSTTTKTKAKKISEISFNDDKSKIIFKKQPGTGRQDIVNTNSYLDIVEIKQWNPEVQDYSVIKTYDFIYSYFNPTGDVNSKRLKLEEVSMLPEDDAYKFVYSDIALPAKTSFAQDYYGYYNGKNTNTNLVPVTPISSPPFNQNSIGNADRSVQDDKNQAGILKKIYYPTKGWTSFDYQTNDYSGMIPSSSSVMYNGSAQGEGAAQVTPAPYIECEDGSICCSIPGKCIVYDYVSFNVAEGATIQLSLNIVDSTPYEQSSNHSQHGRVCLYKSSQNYLYDSIEHWEDFSYSQTFTGVPGGTYVLRIEAYGEKIHTTAYATVTSSTSNMGNILGAGLRVASIENHDTDGTLLNKKKYTYTQPGTSLTSGKQTMGYPISFIGGSIANYAVSGSSFILYDILYSVNSHSQYNTESNSIAYEYVKEEQVDGNNVNNGFTLYKFNTETDWYADVNLFVATPPMRGKMLEKSIYKTLSPTESLLLRKEINTYISDNSKVSRIKGFKVKRLKTVNLDEDPADPLDNPSIFAGEFGIPTSVDDAVDFITVDVAIPWTYLKKTEVTEKFYDASNNPTNTLITKTDFIYSNPTHLQLSKQVTTTSRNETQETRYFYPGDTALQNEPMMADLISRNIISAPVKTQVYLNGGKISEEKTIYNSWSSQSGLPHILPEIVQAAKGDDIPENRIVTVSRDLAGNPTEVKLENGISVSYIWGYSNTKPVVKIENLSYNFIDTDLINQIKDTSTNGTEEELIDKFNLLRIELPGKMITTYTYKALIGLSSVIDPRGYKTTYHYDNYGRLQFVKDNEDKILTENFYHYKD